MGVTLTFGYLGSASKVRAVATDRERGASPRGVLTGWGVALATCTAAPPGSMRPPCSVFLLHTGLHSLLRPQWVHRSGVPTGRRRGHHQPQTWPEATVSRPAGGPGCTVGSTLSPLPPPPGAETEEAEPGPRAARLSCGLLVLRLHSSSEQPPRSRSTDPARQWRGGDPQGGSLSATGIGGGCLPGGGHAGPARPPPHPAIRPPVCLPCVLRETGQGTCRSPSRGQRRRALLQAQLSRNAERTAGPH